MSPRVWCCGRSVVLKETEMARWAGSRSLLRGVSVTAPGREAQAAW